MPGEASRYRVVPYEERWRPDVLRLRECFHGIDPAWNERNFRWQQEENPCFDAPLIRLALFEGRVVGMRVMQPARWLLGASAEPVDAPTFSGTAFEPEHRNKGLFRLLTRASEDMLAERGVPFALNLSAGAATIMGSLAEGWRSIGPLQRAVRTHRFDGPGVGRLLLRYARRAAAMLPIARPAIELTSAPRPDEMARLAASRAAPDGVARRLRDEAYFRWRFRDPSSLYRFAWLKRGASVAGYVVLHRPAPPLDKPWLAVVDWDCDETLGWDALADAVAYLGESLQRPLLTWTALWPGAVRERLESRLGFVPTPEAGPLPGIRPTLLVRKIGADADGQEAWCVRGCRIDARESWDLRLSDSDAY